MGSDVRRWSLVFLVLLAATIALRWPILGRSVIDWDESVYLLVSSSVAAGSLPYVEVFDHKQPFLFVVLLASFVFPDPVVGMRLICSLFVAVTATGLGLISRRFSGGCTGGWVAAGLYVLASTTSGGLATNAELLFAPFVTWAFALLAVPRGFAPNDGRTRMLRFCAAGWLAGLAVQIKLVASFDVLVLGVAAPLLWSSSDARWASRVREFWKRSGCFWIVAVAPLAVALVVFAVFGQLEAFWFANVEFNFVYTHLQVDRLGLLTAALVRQAHEGILWLLAVSIGAAVWLMAGSRPRGGPAAGPIALVSAWLLSDALSVLAAAKFYDHHFLQMLPPAVLLISVAVGRASRDRRKVVRIGAAVLVTGLLVGLAPVALHVIERAAQDPDHPKDTAAFLRDHGARGSLVFVANSQPVIYLLSGARMPSRYVLPAWYVRPEFRKRLDIELERFLDEVFDQRPMFVVMERDHPWLPDGELVEILTQRYLPGRYRPMAQIGRAIVFRRLEESPRHSRLDSSKTALERPPRPVAETGRR